MQWLVTELTWRQPFPFTSNFVLKTGITVTKNAYLTLFLVRMSQIILKKDNYFSRFMAAVGRYCYTLWHAVPWIALYVFQIKTFELNHTGPNERQKDHLPAFHKAIPCKQLLLFSSNTTLEASFASGKEGSNSYSSINSLPLGLQEPEEEQKTDSTQTGRPSQRGIPLQKQPREQLVEAARAELPLSQQYPQQGCSWTRHSENPDKSRRDRAQVCTRRKSWEDECEVHTSPELL